MQEMAAHIAGYSIIRTPSVFDTLAASTIRPGAEVSSDCTQEEAIMEGMFGEKAENNGPTKSSGNANHPATHDYQIKHINTLALPKVSSEPQTDM